MGEGAKGSGFRPGFVFKDGKGYLFEEKRLTVMRPWPRPAAWRCSGRGKGFRHVQPAMGLEEVERWARPGFVVEVLSELTAHGEPRSEEELARIRRGLSARQRAARAYLDAIPLEARRLVRPFRQRQWAVLSMLGRVPGGADLVRSAPALGWALASNLSFHRPGVARPMRACRTWVNKPRRELAGWLGFPPTRSAARLLAKVEAAAANRIRLLSLRARMREGAPLARAAAHLPRLNAAVLDVVGRRCLEAICGPGLLHGLAGLREGPAMDALRDLLDTHAMVRMLEVPEPRLGSLERIRPVHDELVEQLNRRPVRAPRVIFPPPPLPGDGDVEPITTPLALAEEGRAMHHCVATYAHWVASGQGYVYRMTAPERATLTIEPLPRGGWAITQLRGPANRRVSEETAARARRWLAGIPEHCAPADPTPIFPEFVAQLERLLAG